MKRYLHLVMVLAAWAGFLPVPIRAAEPAATRELVRARVQQEYGSLFELYKHLHAHPELSLHVEKTGERLAEELRKAGYEVTARVGGYGAAGGLRNGAGPTVLVRGDLDAARAEGLTGLLH